MRPHISSLTQSVRKSFTDTFQRSNTSSDPGTTTDGSRWKVLSGAFNIASNVLNTATSASNYPLSVVEMGVQNVNIGLVASGQGATAALWVTDSGNWWGVQTFSQPENCNCYDVGYSCSCTDQSYDCSCVPQYASGTTCSTCYTQSCTYGPNGTYYCSGGGLSCDVRVYGVGCVAWTYTAPTCSANLGTTCTAVPYDCNCYSWSSAWYSCQTCYRTVCSTCYYTACNTCYPQYFKILKNISGTVTAVWSQAVAAVSAAFRVKTSGDVITIKAYSDSGMTSQIGSDMTYTATGSAKSTKFGLAIAPSSYNQTATISKITIDRN